MKTLKDLKRATDKFKEGMTKVRHSLPQHQALMKKIKKPTLSEAQKQRGMRDREQIKEYWAKNPHAFKRPSESERRDYQKRVGRSYDD